MKRLYYVLIIFVLGHGALGQTRKPSCPCPDPDLRSQPTMIFDFGKGRRINLCGYREEGRKDTVFSAFELYQCGRMLDRSDETGTSKFTRRNDTLFLQEISLLPVGRNFSTVAMPFRVRKFYFQKDFVYDSTYYLSTPPRYTTAQINRVLQQYAQLSWQNLDSVNLVAHRLLWACISGSSKAGGCLRQIKNRSAFFDGAIAEEWEGTWAEYRDWQDKGK